MHLSQNRHKKKIYAIIMFLVFFVGILVGQLWSTYGFLNNDDGVEITKVLNLYSKTRSSDVNFDNFWNVWDRVKEKYVDQPVNDVDLFYGAISGIVSGLDDPYSVYLPPKKAQEFSRDLSGKFEGIGAEIGIRQGMLTVIAPLSGSPSEQVGIKTGDQIYKIDGHETYSLSLEESVLRIRGKKGTQVVLTIGREGSDDGPQEISVTRDTIKIPTIISEIRKGVGYIRISYFNETTWREFDTIVKDLLTKDPKGLILDLRSNPGGYLQTAVDISSEWITAGVIVKEKMYGGQEKTYLTDGAHRLSNIQTVVLVDQGSASASEIVSGALQDYEKAKIVGERTFGKGSVQDFEAFPDGSALKLTVAKWVTPKGRIIEGGGIEPDIVLEKMFEIKEGEEPKDLGLQKAFELLGVTD